jgi:hypothetical protein
MSTPSIESLETSLRLVQALHLARRGRMREAEGIVAPGGTPPLNPVELQALAALATGQGDYRRALPLWRLLRQRDAFNDEAKRMIDAIELWQARPAWMKFIVPGIAVLLGLVLLVVLLKFV